MENIKGGILQSFGHDRAGALLKFINEIELKFPCDLVCGLEVLQKQYPPQEIEDRRFHRCVPAFSRANRSQDDVPVSLGDTALRRDVGAINREAGNKFAYHGAKRIQGKISTQATALGDLT